MPQTIKGIYRYRLNKNNEIVYIGVGNIRERLNEPKRQQWQFDQIEYTPIENKKEMLIWEEFWLKKFKDTNGRLPIYNKLSTNGAGDE